jgi:hypothetical protein
MCGFIPVAVVLGSFVLATVGTLVAPRTAAAQTQAQPATQPLADPVESGREAMRVGAYPWYDSSKDDLQRINVKPPKPPKPPSNWDWGDWSFEGIKVFFDSLGALVRVLLYALFAALLALLVYILVKVFLKQSSKDGADEDEEDDEDRLGDVDRIEELPIQIAAPRGDFLAEARRRYEAGDYSGAIIYLFSYQLLYLDRHQRIQLTKGKTNRQYLREVRSLPQLQSMLARTMVAFEDVFFGHHPLERDAFEACWREVDEFQRLGPQGGAT